MEMKNTEILELIFKSRKSIEEINKTIEDRQNIKLLAKEIIKIEESINSKIQEEEKNLKKYRERLDELEKEETKENTINIKNIIMGNLPKDVIYNNGESKDELKLYIKIPQDKKKAKDCLVGRININTDGLDDINVVVKIGNNNSQCFKISKDTPLRIYKVISYIHDNLSYDE